MLKSDLSLVAMPQLRRWDLFCAVVDNYGDAGISWRLARQLASEHALSVRLFVDDLSALARIAPKIDPSRGEQLADGVQVRTWQGPGGAAPADCEADVVIEGFGCGLPAPYLAAMAARESPPIWINLEYLSAESWIEGCHGLPSRHPSPSLPLTRYFFFPGFSGASGGLLRERDLLARRDAFRADAKAQAAFRRRLGIGEGDAQVISLFCYPDAPVPALLDAWADGDAPVLCIVPQGVATSALDAWTGGGVPHAGQALRRGRLTLVEVPFMAQDDYDRLLWSCDLNFVRGEDSFVRAQWAARAFVWQPYPQAEGAHRLKLDAFLDRYVRGLAPDPAAALRAFAAAWSGDGELAPAWNALSAAHSRLSAHAAVWAKRLAQVPELASRLVKFCADRV
ncbi:MAG TPA: elongation factor P maturation arginine rhamnosyltransferase EarP [Casimicrobiaceae bacterium]|nr:elongation factor P maturation arginine rhamnosyltransferase EarP [Casimicrobiaceae bacterium]